MNWRRRSGRLSHADRLERCGATTKCRRQNLQFARFAFYAAQLATVLSNCDRSRTLLADADFELARYGDPSRWFESYFNYRVMVIDENWNDQSPLGFDWVRAGTHDP